METSISSLMFHFWRVRFFKMDFNQ